MNRVLRLTKEVQAHDSQLFAKKHNGNICIFRKSKRYEDFQCDDCTIIYARDDKHLVFSLTDNWSSDGRPVDWGIEPILARLKAHDLWNRDVASDFITSYEKTAKSKDRDASNNIESFLYDFRSSFKKTFSDVNTSTLKKIDRRIKDGN